LWVGYSQHKHFHRYEASDLEAHFSMSGSHPDVYVAAGTRANYPDICESGCHNWDTFSLKGGAEAPHAGTLKTGWYYNSTTNGADFGCVTCLIDLDGTAGVKVNQGWFRPWGWGGSPKGPRDTEPQPSGSAPYAMTDAPVSPFYQHGTYDNPGNPDPSGTWEPT
jgi:hypothetical protein